MNRRELFDPGRLARGAGQIAGLFEPGSGRPQTASADLPLLRFGRRAMATGFEIALPLGTPNALSAAEDVLDLVDRLESQLTVYRDDSEISNINQRAETQPVDVEARLFALLKLAQQIHGDTNGAFDIATGALIKAWGFYRRLGRVPSDMEQAEALGRSGMRHVILNSQSRTITLTTSGVELNLGSIGKGHALDRVGERLQTNWDISSGVLHGGSSSVLALGIPPGMPQGWPVGLGHPSNLERRVGVVWLRNRALGTSSPTFQNLEHEGRKLGHILDPRSGWPAQELASATAIAPTAAQADALATAFFVLGADRTRVYCENHPGVGAVVLAHEQDVPMVMGNVDFEPPARS